MSERPCPPCSFLLVVLLLAGGCSDTGLVALDGQPTVTVDEPVADPWDGPPEIEIIEPVVQAVYGTDFPLSLLAQVGDAEDPIEELRIDWESMDTGELVANEVVPASTGQGLAIAWLDPGVHTLLATVTDSSGQTAFDSVISEVEEAEEPPDDPVDGGRPDGLRPGLRGGTAQRRLLQRV
ncbi:MAG: hypothetical protein GY898_32630 [Proteobacteria bacterium]|nr:hypothetical protein [Pseudomonadota bacterium]